MIRLLKRVPFTFALVLLLALLAVVTGPLTGPSALVRHAVGVDLAALGRHQWWSLLTADFFVDNAAQLVIVLVAAAVGVGAAEMLMGTARTALAFVTAGIAASVIGLGIEALGVLAGEYWAEAVRNLVTVDPLGPILGTVAAASAFASVLWRRRIRFVVVASIVMFLLYSGQPSDFFRLIAVLIGLLLGSVLARRRLRLERWTSSHHETRVLLAVLATIFALGPVITLVAHGRFGLLSPLGDFIADGMPPVHPGGTACTVAGPSQACNVQLAAQADHGVATVVLALLPLAVVLVGAYGLLLGRRVAVYVVAIAAAADGMLAALYFGVIPALGYASRVVDRVGNSPEYGAWLVANAVLPIGFAVIVLSQRRHFPNRSSPDARRRFLTTMGVAAAVAAGVYLGLGSILATQFRPVVGVLDLVADLPERFIPVSFLSAERRDFAPVTLATRLLYHGVGPLLWVVLLLALIALLRGQRPSLGDPGDAAIFRRLEREAGSSMAFPGTWAGNSYWFDAERRMGIAYRVANQCAVTTSDPVGAPRDRRESLSQFIRFCDSNAWTPVFYGVHGDWAELLTEAGWSTLVVAEETIIDPTTFQMTGKKWQDVRSSVNRAAREGVRVTWGRWQDLGPRVINQIAEISELWVVEKKLPELGFTLGGLDELRDPDVLLAVASDDSGTVQAVTSWLPTWRDGVVVGRTLDFMRRRADGMNGVMEFVIAEAAVRAQLDGLEFLSLSGAPLAVAPSDEKHAALDGVLAMLGRSLEPAYGFRSLFTFKQKFQPRLEPLELAYPDVLSLPAIAVALSRCYVPDLTLRESAALVRSLR
ncbi:MAG: DUF2156 domain-containing protein [Salinibacterium sp.]|nr:DUF2156 domain-containing protein [Salinibacterium sp.]